MSDTFDGFQYQILEREAEKKREREQLQHMMLEFLAKGGEIKRVDMKGAPKPRLKFLNRQQRKAVKHGSK